MKLKIFIIIGLVCLSNRISAQVLNIGDKLPPVVMSHVMNYKSSSLQLSDFNGKMLIIDFWATWCGPCINALSEFDKLQKEFTNDIVILPVTYETKEKVEQIFKNNLSVSKVSLPIALDDTLLHQYFKPRTLPHEVVVNREGVIIAITGGDNITEANLKKMTTDEKSVVLYEKKSGLNFNVEKPFFMSEIGQSLLLKQGILTHSIEGIPTEFGRRGPSLSHDTRIFGTNAPPLDIFKTALLKRLAGSEVMPANRVKLLVKDKSFFTEPKNFNANQKYAWERDNFYCFDYIVPLESKVSVYDYLKQDLEKFFNVKSRLVDTIVDCYVLKMTDSLKLKSIGGKRNFDEGKEVWTINYQLSRFVTLVNVYTPFPIVDETDFKGLATLSVRTETFKDPEMLNATLSKYGLGLTKEKRKLKFMVIEDTL